MSLILDALTRAETEKRNAASDTADLLTPAPADSNDRFPPWTLPALALLAGVLTTSLVFWVVNQGSPAEQADQQQASTPVAATGTAPPSMREAPLNPAADRPIATRPSESPAVAAGNRPRPASPSVAAISGNTSETAAQQQGTDSRVAALYAQREEPVEEVSVDVQSSTGPAAPPQTEPAPEPAMTETPVDLDAVLRDVREDVRSDGLEPHPAPLLADLSQQFRNRVPTLMYLRHDFNGRGRSTVLINGQTLAAGQRTKGVEVREILGDSVILRYDGTEFRLRALNSWVNL